MSQLPFRSTSRHQTRVNVLDDLTEYVFAEQAGALGAWEVNFELLSDADINSLRAFFDSQKGRYGRFTFLDPLRSLLKWSEDYTQAVWQKSGAFTITAGQSDPLGGTGASLVTNVAGVQNDLWQTIGYSPESQHFTSSVWLKAASPAAATLQCSDGNAQATDAVVNVGTTWRRFSVTRKFSASPGPVTQFLLRFAAGQSLFVFGAMLAYLPGPGDYGRTANSIGVHPLCRFDDDVFRQRALALGAGAVRLAVVEVAG